MSLRGGAEDKKNIIRFVKAVPIVGILLISSILIFIFIYSLNHYLNLITKDLKQKIRAEIISSSKKSLKKINNLLNQTYNINYLSYKNDILTDVTVGEQLLKNIYTQNKNLPKKEIYKKIKKILSNIRFFDDRSGYYFIYDMSGNIIMLPVRKEMEGKNFFNYHDIKGNYIVKNFIEGLKNKNGTFEEWYYYKPNTNIIEKKMGFAKKFEPLKIFIGSAIYETTLRKNAIVDFIRTISKLKKHNLTILNINGKILYSGGFLSKYNLKKIINLANKNRINSTIIEYKKGNTLFIFKYNKKMNLVFIQKIILSKLPNSVENKKEKIRAKVYKIFYLYLILILLIILLIILFILFLSGKIEGLFDNYEKMITKEKEKAENTARIKSEFLANMSHEIRTPLNAILGFIKILQEKDLNKENQKYLNIIEKSGENLLVIINDILDFSKIEAGKFHIEQIEFNPKQEFEAIKELFTSNTSSKNILLEMKTENLKYNIITDPTRIKQVVANLLSNAIKFTPNGKKIQLNIKYDDKSEKLFLEVTDEGIGIKKDKLNTIFQAFSQANNSTNREYGGTGLGLTISYKLIQLLKGKLKVESKVGKGSRFYFKIPAKKGKLAKDTIDVYKKRIKKQKFNQYILVVEDNLANQMFMKILLKKMGIIFDIANNGVEAVEKFKNHKYNLILMDENMPNMNGIEATKKIRQIEKEKNLEYTIIVALTANALEGDKDRFILAGMDYYLSKPLDIEKLKDILYNNNHAYDNRILK